MFHAIKKKTHMSAGLCAVKLDMHKAYDGVEWGFLKAMIQRMGFHGHCFKLMMECVSSVSYRVRVIGAETEEFTPTHGLRHRDPLSPYMFLICSEGLSSMLLHEEEISGLEGVKVCRNSPFVYHLFLQMIH